MFTGNLNYFYIINIDSDKFMEFQVIGITLQQRKHLNNKIDIIHDSLLIKFS